MTQQTEREKFETWAEENYCSKDDLERGRITGYRHAELNQMYRGWQARAALEAKQAEVQLPVLESRIDVLEVAKELKENVAAFGDTKTNAKANAAFYLRSQYERIAYLEQQVRAMLAARGSVSNVTFEVPARHYGTDAATKDAPC